MNKTNFEHYINNFSNFPFEVCVENEDPNYGSAVIRVYDGEDVVFTSRFYEDFNSYDLAGVIEEVLLWCWTPRKDKLSTEELQLLQLLWQQGYRFVGKTWMRNGWEEDGRCYDQIKVATDDPETIPGDSFAAYSLEAFNDAFPSMEYGWHSIASLLGKEVM